MKKLKTLILSTLLLSGALEAKEKALIVLSGEKVLQLKDGKSYATGYYLPEIAGPSMALQKMGFELVYANPNGSEPTMDHSSDSPTWFANEEEYRAAKAFVEGEAALKKPKLFKDVLKNVEAYSVVFVPGGHAPMEDLATNEELGQILRHFHSAGKPLGLICHGTIALNSTRNPDPDESWIFEAKRMTGFSTAEEKIQESSGALGGYMKFYLQDALEEAGAAFKVGEPWTSHVVRDGMLVTGQNPQSEKAFTAAFVEAVVDFYLKQAGAEAQPYDSRLPDGKLMTVIPAREGAYKTFYLGKKLPTLKQREFVEKLRAHVELVAKNLAPLGMTSYEVMRWGNFEIALQSWESADAATAAFASDAGKAVLEDSKGVLEGLVFKERNQE